MDVAFRGSGLQNGLLLCLGDWSQMDALGDTQATHPLNEKIAETPLKPSLQRAIMAEWWGHAKDNDDSGKAREALARLDVR
ncbi:hypothetical protein HDU97_006570 [Phlyctochytrium planicorne]|nr:hypothetical protein HDU97_006570 [Phlyctochytrium planicorne]